MEGLMILLAIVVLVSPFFMSISALGKISSLRRDVDSLRKRMEAITIPPKQIVVRQESVVRPIAPPPPDPCTILPAHSAVDPPTPPPAPRPVPPVQTSPVLHQPPARSAMEFMLGGKAAAFAGAAILLMGIVFLVGYAIQHAWIGPGARVVLGLLSGGALVGIGYGLECRGGGKYGLLARALTGAGSALFYFVVFAAYGIYHLIGAPACGAGLFVSALAVFGLAMLYHSQAVGLLGVLGAFVTPLLIGGEMERGVFPLVYVAVITVPVVLLGLRRNWQVLYNVSFVFTVFYFCAWLDWIGSGEFSAGLLFAVVYFAECAALGLLKLRCEQRVSGRRADTVRLLLASPLLLWAAHWILNAAGWSSWTGLAYLLLALLHFGLAAFAQRQLRRFSEESLAFLGGGMLFAVLALPAQMDGEWVSLGWALEGSILAWFAVRVTSRTLTAVAAFIGLLGILKALCYDLCLYSQAPGPFLNARFAVGLISCGLLGVQGWLAGRFPPEHKFAGPWRDGLWWIGILAGLVVFAADLFWTLGATDEWAWLLISMALLAVGVVIGLTSRPDSSLRTLGCLLLGLLPLQIAWFYLVIASRGVSSLWSPFSSPIPWLFLAALGTVVFWTQPHHAKESASGTYSRTAVARTLSVASLAGALLVLTVETGRIRSEWSGTLITVLWAVWALTLIVFGLTRRKAPYRIFGLMLFGLTTLKVLLVDSSVLRGIERIVACMGTGMLLLVVAFVYQRVAARFLSAGDDM